MTQNVPEIVLCLCPAFDEWYSTNRYDEWPIRICTCGHPTVEHIDESGSCTGESERTT